MTTLVHSGENITHPEVLQDCHHRADLQVQITWQARLSSKLQAVLEHGNWQQQCRAA